jgi:hypothetical protein
MMAGHFATTEVAWIRTLIRGVGVEEWTRQHAVRQVMLTREAPFPPPDYRK